MRIRWKNTLYLFVWAALIALALLALTGIGSADARRRLTVYEDAARRSAAQCYALEGRYPRSADILFDRYGLPRPEQGVLLHYEYQGSNLLPDIRAVLSGEGGAE